MVRLGIIGLGTNWEQEYPSALRKLSDRVQVSALFDHVTTRATQAQKTFPEARIHTGVLALADRYDVDALLLLDMAWHTQSLFSQLCARQKPIYVATNLSLDAAALEHLHATAILTGTTLMPEFRWRYTPASGRLQELLATQLGPARQIVIRASRELLSRFLESRDYWTLDAIDWCSYVLKRSPIQVQSTRKMGTTLLRIEYQSSPDGTPAPFTEIVFEDIAELTDDESVVLEIEGTHGEARILSCDLIEWSRHEEADEFCENLESDRTAVEVLIDHFCRRVVGALIPVADIRDIHRSLGTLAALRQACDAPGTTIQVTRS